VAHGAEQHAVALDQFGLTQRTSLTSSAMINIGLIAQHGLLSPKRAAIAPVFLLNT
jgi:hypothetical protein